MSSTQKIYDTAVTQALRCVCVPKYKLPLCVSEWQPHLQTWASKSGQCVTASCRRHSDCERILAVE